MNTKYYPITQEKVEDLLSRLENMYNLVERCSKMLYDYAQSNGGNDNELVEIWRRHHEILMNKDNGNDKSFYHDYGYIHYYLIGIKDMLEND